LAIDGASSQAEAETVSVPASVDVILPDKKLFALV
jgi:hypothetical protein